MFLQRYRHTHHNDLSLPQKQIKFVSKIEMLLKQAAPPEIKQHQKKNPYINSRTYLIQNTRKVIKPAPRVNEEDVNASAEVEAGQLIFTPRKTFSRTSVDLSSRQARRTAAKNFRQRIWKSSDITPLVKAQQQRLLRSAKRPSMAQFGQSQQKIYRYQDSFLLTDSPKRRQAIRKEWLEGAVRNNQSVRMNSSHKNPQKLQITNIQFNKKQMEDSVGSNHSRQVINRDKRKQLRMLHYSSLVRQERRPNTTGGYNRDRQDDNIIQPW